MAVFLPAVIVFLLTMCQSGHAWNNNISSLDTARWLCEHHSHALSSKFEDILDEDKVTRKYYCSLYFDYELPKEEWTAVCEYMFPAHLEKADAATEIGHFYCKYDILFLCHRGKFPVHHLCVEFVEEERTLEEAAKDCETRGDGYLPTKIEADILTQHTLLSINPRLLGYKSELFWMGSESSLLMTRSWLPFRQGTTFPRTEKTQKAAYICLSMAMKQAAMYEIECNIYKDSFKLTAAFHEGTCYILSPSLNIPPIVKGSPDVRQLHEKCRWFSREDHAVNPMSASRKQAIDKVLERTRHEYTYLMTTAVKTVEKNQGELDGWAVRNPSNWFRNVTDTPIYPGAKMWPQGRPVLWDNADQQPNVMAVVQPAPLRTGMLLDVPAIFRSHLMCAIGITTADLAYANCDKDWMGITRDEGRVMCVRPFTTELEGKTYDEAMQFCRQLGAVLAPMESADEQEVILQLVMAHNPGGGSMWLGAKRRESRGPFYWELDGKQVAEGTGTNWAPNEPYNLNGREGCMQIYLTRGKKDFGQWNDLACDERNFNAHTRIIGGVCAKYLI